MRLAKTAPGTAPASSWAPTFKTLGDLSRSSSGSGSGLSAGLSQRRFETWRASLGADSGMTPGVTPVGFYRATELVTTLIEARDERTLLRLSALVRLIGGASKATWTRPDGTFGSLMRKTG